MVIFGNISSLNRIGRIKLSRASAASLEDLERGVLSSILEGIQAHFGSGEKERLLACKLAIYGCPALVPANNQTQHNLQLCRRFSALFLLHSRRGAGCSSQRKTSL